MPSFSLATIVGARPQFIKAAAVSRAIAEFNARATEVRIDERIVHTGQHYDQRMSQVFFDQLQIPRPAVNLEVGSGAHGRQTGLMLERIEAYLLETRPDWVLVYGDTNSTLAGALAGAKLHIRVAHVEAGLRSFNRRMPEEINRILTDHAADLLLCPTDQAVTNLGKEGITRGVHQVGDVMYDSVLFHTQQAEGTSDILSRLCLAPQQYYLATLHRAENTDDPRRLNGIFAALERSDWPVILPLHPRTRQALGDRLAADNARLVVTDPVSYLDMLMLEKHARIILTDSGGVQKEAYWMGVPCVTLRDETEWVELVEAGWNVLAGADATAVQAAVDRFESHFAATEASTTNQAQYSRTPILQHSPSPPGAGPLYGDGRSAHRIANLLAQSTVN
jgi:UDP-N-acetylglucosamine 2-epimerase